MRESYLVLPDDFSGFVCSHGSSLDSMTGQCDCPDPVLEKTCPDCCQVFTSHPNRVFCSECEGINLITAFFSHDNPRHSLVTYGYESYDR